MNVSLSETLRKYLSQTVVSCVSESAIDSSGVWATETEVLATANFNTISLCMRGFYGMAYIRIFFYIDKKKEIALHL